MILTSSFLILFKSKCRLIVLRKFSRVSLFLEKGVIFPPLTSVVTFIGASFFSVIFFVGVSIGGSSGFLSSSSALKNRSVGALSSGVV